MNRLSPEEMLSFANELNYNFFLCDENMMNWSFLSVPFLRILQLDSARIEENPQFWASLVDWEGRDPEETLRTSLDHEGISSLTLAFRTGNMDYTKIHLRISNLISDNAGNAYRFGSAEIAGEDVFYKQEALLSRDNAIEISARIQRTLLTGSISEKRSGLIIEAETIPSREVDGDFYEFLQLTPDVTDFLIGDVMGKGVPAALLAAAVKTAYYKSVITNRMGQTLLPELSSMLRSIDSLIGEDLLALNKFLTLYFCRLDSEHSLLSFIDAGHTSFIYLDAEEGSCWNVKGSNMPLGFSGTQEYKTYHLPFNQNDLLFFYSDGIPEVSNGEGEYFGEERLRQFIQAHRHLKPAELLKSVFNVAFYFASQAFVDDVTGVVVKVDRIKDLPEVNRQFLYTREKPADLGVLREEFEADLFRLYPREAQENSTKLTFALMEACGNCITHSGGEFSLIWRMYPGSVEVLLDFSGEDFDWYSQSEPTASSFKTGGYGSYLIRQGTDSLLLLKGGESRKRLQLYKEFR